MVIVDTNVLVALADRGRPYQLVDLVDADLRRMAELVRRYSDRRLGGTDASIVAIAERVGTTTVATLNRRDFDNLRPKHAAALDIVPARH